MLCVPPFLALLFIDAPPAQAAALGIYLLAVITDLLDGFLARRWNCVTDFGKVMDPLADKLVVVGALISLAWMRLVPIWMVLAIVGRELVIIGFRGVASARGIYIYTSTLARWKAAFQMVAIAFLLAPPVARHALGARWPAPLDGAVGFGATLTLWVAVLLTVATGVWYLWKNRQVVVGIFVR